MSPSITISGRVCLCEWSGPVTITMVVSLLSQLKHAQEVQGEGSVLILNLSPSSAKDITKRSTVFIDVLPALLAYCQEVVMACEGESGLLEQLRRCLCCSATTPLVTFLRPLIFFELLDDAFTHAQGLFPHDVLELRRQRIRSGVWAMANEADPIARIRP